MSAYFAIQGLIAQTESSGVRAVELEPPGTPLGWLLLLGGFGTALVATIYFYIRDSRDLPFGWGIGLAALRLAVFAGLLVIALNPQERTQRSSFRPSRVVLVVDTSLSMRHPADMPSSSSETTVSNGQTTPNDQTEAVSRAEAVARVMGNTELLNELRQRHEVSVYTFDRALVGPHHVLPKFEEESGAAGDGTADAAASADIDWAALLEPAGLETRLGESLLDLSRQVAGRTLSGIVVVSDGGQNAGLDTSAVQARATASHIRLFPVGIGSSTDPVNLRIADVQAPTDVQKGDPFDISVFVQGQGLSGNTVKVELVEIPAEENAAAIVLDESDVMLLEENVPAEVTFRRAPDAAGRHEYQVRVRAAATVAEVNQDDNTQALSVDVFDRPLRVLMFAGGPMRDYQFVRNLLYRHPSIQVDVLLQTGQVGISQEADQILFEFPSSREDMLQYDVVMAFDPDWSRLSQEQVQLLADWVSNEAGGLVLVAGDVHTPTLAGLSEQNSPLRELYPVVLGPYLFDFQYGNDAAQPWPVELTSDGLMAGFLQVTDVPGVAENYWKDFPGFYRAYPTNGAKAGATVYAFFTDPRSQNEYGAPILMASQFYGQGRALYLGTAEIWLLRARDEAQYDRFWLKLCREMGQGRMQRGNRRGLLLVEQKRAILGQTVRVRARVLDSQYEPLDAPEVELRVIDPRGKPLVPDRKLRRDPDRPGEFVGDFRAQLPGNYRLVLPIPPAEARNVTEEVTVALPQLEDEDIRQNTLLLSDLAEETGGTYMRWDDMPAALPGLLTDRGEQVLIDERLTTLWDRRWIMFLLVGLLSVEWLSRKLLKLA